MPTGCDRPLEEDPDINADVPMMHSGGRLRMASINEMSRPNLFADGVPPTRIDESVETEDEDHESGMRNGVGHRRMSEVPFVDLQEKSNPLG